MILILYGLPGDGKSLYAVKRAIQEMGKKNGKKVFANFPIHHPSKGFCYKWDMDLIYDLTDAFVVIDEGYKDVSSRDHKNFTVDQHTAFGTNRHNRNDFWLLAHSPARIDVIIREMCSSFAYIKKWSIPLTSRPLFFKICGYIDDPSTTAKVNSQSAYSVDWMLFKMKFARCYDTHFFGHTPSDRNYEKWFDNEDCPIVPKKSFFESLRSKLFKVGVVNNV